MTIRRVLVCLVAWSLALTVRTQAQILDTQFILAASADCSTASSCAVFDVGQAPSLALTISGTFVATLAFESTSDGQTWVAVLANNIATDTTTSTATSGTFSVQNIGVLKVRVRASAYSSGTVKIVSTRGFSFSTKRGAASSGPFLAGNGSASAPVYTFAAATGTGFYNAGANQIGWAAGGVEAGRLYSKNVWIVSDQAVYSFGLGQDTTLTRTGAGKVSLAGTTPMLQFGGATSSFPSLKQNGTGLDVRLADDSAPAPLNTGSLGVSGNLTFSTALRIGANVVAVSGTAPSAPASCGTSPTVSNANGTVAFNVTGGTGGVATGCSVTMPAATNGWNCSIANITQTAAHRADRATVQTASTTTSVTWEYVTVSTGAATAFTASDVFRAVCVGY